MSLNSLLSGTSYSNPPQFYPPYTYPVPSYSYPPVSDPSKPDRSLLKFGEQR